jgi:hypothetical protein
VQGPFDLARGYWREVCLLSETSGRDFVAVTGPIHQRQGLVIGCHGTVLLTGLRLRVGCCRRIISRTGRPHEPATHWKCEDVLRRPVSVEGRSKKDADHLETHSASSAQSPKGGLRCQRPLKPKEKRPSLGLGRIQYLNVAERKSAALNSNTVQRLPNNPMKSRYFDWPSFR